MAIKNNDKMWVSIIKLLKKGRLLTGKRKVETK